MTVASVLSLVLLLTGTTTSRRVFETLYEWNLINFDLPYGSFVPENNLFTGLEIYWDRIFLALPNLKSGVPATLAWLPRPDQPGAAFIGQSPALQPYPSLGWQGTAGNCSGLVSVYRMRIDRCDRLWVLDSGVITTLDNFTPACPPKILVFDLKTDRLVRNIVLPKDVVRPNTLLTNLVIDYEIVGGSRGDTYFGVPIPQESCDDAFLYMTDTANAGIVVYDIRNDQSWRVFHPSMLPHPDYCTYHIAGENFTLPDAIVGIALSPETSSQHSLDPYGYRQQRLLYFQPFAGIRLFSMPTSVLQTPPDIDTDLQIGVVFEKTSQSASLATDPNDGTIYFNPVTELALATLKPGSTQAQLIIQDPDRLQFSSDILVTPRDNYNVWFVSSKFQKFFRQTYDPHVINFRIMRIAQTHTPVLQTPIVQSLTTAAPQTSYKNSLFFY
ncbi:hypothetical protein L9F63_005800 [Diploptera punctata]|uniref:Bee-milk protein n=1 Tax=Diploptera punctata TaxID=6984 RepID=A0AAD7ZCT5_DIPPU|nr:hypothetical protein L9F63_005800 [Diploptera punctata]